MIDKIITQKVFYSRLEPVFSMQVFMTADPLAEPNVIENALSGAGEIPFDGIPPKN